MHQSEKLVKRELIKKGYKVWKRGHKGTPDFECIGNGRHIFVEVKSSNDGIHINQFKKITELLQKGFQVFVYYVDKESKLESYELTIILKINEPQIQIKINNESKSRKLKCDCGQIIQTDFWMGQHILGKRHKKNIEKQKTEKGDKNGRANT